jgi:hypothetical protein
MRLASLVVLSLPWVALAARPADACSLLGNGTWARDPAYADDRVAPTAPAVDATFHAGDRDDMCGFEAYLEVRVSGATDDRTASDQLGYRVTTSSAQLAPALGDGPVTIAEAGAGALVFHVFEHVEADTIELEVRAVDLNGNHSEPTRVTRPYVDTGDGGCATGGAASPLLALALGGLVRRRARESFPLRPATPVTGARR